MAFACRQHQRNDLMRFCTRSRISPIGLLLLWIMHSKLVKLFSPAALKLTAHFSYVTCMLMVWLEPAIFGMCRKGKLRDRKRQFNNFTLQNQVIRGISSLSLSLSIVCTFLLSVYLNFDSISSEICEPNSKSWAKFKISKYFLLRNWEIRYELFMKRLTSKTIPMGSVSLLLSPFHRKKGIGCHLKLNLAFWHHFFSSLFHDEKSAPHLRGWHVYMVWMWMWMWAINWTILLIQCASVVCLMRCQCIATLNLKLKAPIW